MQDKSKMIKFYFTLPRIFLLLMFILDLATTYYAVYYLKAAKELNPIGIYGVTIVTLIGMILCLTVSPSKLPFHIIIFGGCIRMIIVIFNLFQIVKYYI